MSNLMMSFELECKCGYVAEIDTNKCDEYICPKCGKILFEKVESSVRHYKSLKEKGNNHES